MERLLGRNLKYSNGEEYPFSKLQEMEYILVLFTFSECQ